MGPDLLEAPALAGYIHTGTSSLPTVHPLLRPGILLDARQNLGQHVGDVELTVGKTQGYGGELESAGEATGSAESGGCEPAEPQIQEESLPSRKMPTADPWICSAGIKLYMWAVDSS